MPAAMIEHARASRTHEPHNGCCPILPLWHKVLLHELPDEHNSIRNAYKTTHTPA